jgi:hypothetical protein
LETSIPSIEFCSTIFNAKLFETLDRRNALKITGLTTGIAGLPIFLSLFQSCKPTGNIEWKPSFLKIDEAQLVGKIADIILPPSPNSPGASAVHVPEFIDIIVRDCLSIEEQDQFRTGVGSLESDFKIRTGNSWLRASEAEVLNYISNVDQEAFEGVDSRVHSTYRQIKVLTLQGYFSMELVRKNQLNYHSIPGEYKGCIDIDSEALAYVDDNVIG